MATKPLKQCRTPGCRNLVASGYCAACRQRTPEQRAAWRKQSMRWYKSKRWEEVKRAFGHKPCELCGAMGAGVVDHVTPHQGDAELFWEPRNWRRLCIRCHNAKSAKELNEGRAGAISR